MRARWIILVAALGIFVAYLEHNLIAGYITVFGSMILLSLRRIEGEIGHFKEPMNYTASETRAMLHLITEIYGAVTSKTAPGSKLFVGDQPKHKN